MKISMIKDRSSPFAFLSVAFFCGVFAVSSSRAQDAKPDAATSDAVASAEAPVGDESVKTAEALPPEVLILNKIEEELKEKYKNEIYIPPSIPSLFFTSEQQSLLREARNGFNTRIPTEDELSDVTMEEDPKLPTGSRKLSLSGIVFINPDEWTIWLNKKRITSLNLPTEVVDLRVYKEFIELKWFDAQTNQVFPIRLRPNQTFSLDTHTFIPG